MRSRRVAIVQRYVARYRYEFYERLSELLSHSGIEIAVVAAGSPPGAQALRNDAVDRAAWLRTVDSRQCGIGPMKFPAFYGTSRHWRDCEGVILTLRGNSIDLNSELLRKPLSGRRVGAWGHIKPYVKTGNALDLAIERRQMRWCDHVFAYTQKGAEEAIEAGVDPSRVTAVNNSTDVSETLELSSSLDSNFIAEFESSNRLTRGKTFGYIGGLDYPKRIDLLADALDILWALDPEVKLVVGGRGSQEHLLEAAVNRGQVLKIGYATAKEKALINRLSEAIVNPGRIGLLAVECLAMDIPILTTDWKLHGPEYEYLREGHDFHCSVGGAVEFANLVLSYARDSDGCRRPQRRQYPTLEAMVRNYADGVVKMVS